MARPNLDQNFIIFFLSQTRTDGVLLHLPSHTHTARIICYSRGSSCDPLVSPKKESIFERMCLRVKTCLSLIH